MVVAFDVSGTATAMIVWIGIKMAAGWNVSQPRAATIFTALGGLMFMFFALTGGLICRPPH